MVYHFENLGEIEAVLNEPKDGLLQATNIFFFFPINSPMSPSIYILKESCEVLGHCLLSHLIFNFVGWKDICKDSPSKEKSMIFI